MIITTLFLSIVQCLGENMKDSHLATHLLLDKPSTTATKPCFQAKAQTDLTVHQWLPQLLIARSLAANDKPQHYETVNIMFEELYHSRFVWSC